MTKEILKIISDSMESLGLNYEFMEWTSEIRYPYFVGEYGETQQSTEDGLQESSFILTGYTRGTWLSLEEIKELTGRTTAHLGPEPKSLDEIRELFR